MGRIKLCGVLIVIIMASSILSFIFLHIKTDELINFINNTESLAESGDKEKAMEYALRLEEQWQEYKKTAGIIVRDEKISNVQSSMSRLYSMIKNDSEDLFAEFSNAISGLEWIVDSELPIISNIL